MKQEAKVYILRLMIQRMLGLLLFLLGSAWAIGPRESIYFICYIGAALVSSLIVYREHPETLGARGKVKTNSPLWDKLLLGAFWLLCYFAIYWIAGAQRRGPASADLLFWFGMACQVLSALLSLRAVLVNPYLESTARIQSDRHQTVCRRGPYAHVRHPSYAALLLWCLSVPMTLRGWGVTVTALVIAILVVVRTKLEDDMLRRGLDGYAAYARQVRFRLIPYIW